jgi:ornithine decarboxylase
MEQYDHYPVLLAEHELGTGSAIDRATRALGSELRARGLEVITASSLDDAEFAVSSEAGIGAALLDWDMFGADAELIALTERIHRLDDKIPVLILAERSHVEDIPLEVAKETEGFFWWREDAPSLVAGCVDRLVRAYVDRLFPPFFGALKHYVDDYNWAWCCPGHNGGMFYRKTPLGRAFFDYVGEPFLRGDLGSAAPELGSVRQHQGPVLGAEKRAAEIFGAERTYFVLNGNSTSNKMVTLALLTPGDLVLFDRSSHQSMYHGALMMAGAVPVYLGPAPRDAHGTIGPVDHRGLDEGRIREQLRRHPLVSDPDTWQRPRPFRLAILANTTYDGACYNEREVLRCIGHLCDYIVFDEAWMGYAKFHPLFADRCGMSLTGLGPEQPGIYATQSTHKCLAGMSQGSQIHVRDSHLRGQARRLGHDRFNEVFMMHTSTSPQYNILASLDVGAEIMAGRAGFALMDEALRESVALRSQVKRYHDEITAAGEGEWFFDVFGPDQVTLSVDQLGAALEEPYLGAAARHTIARAMAAGGISRVPWRDVPEDILVSVPECWMFHPGDQWHDLDGLAPGYLMLDPTKCLLMTPGAARGRRSVERGIPAAVPAAALRDKGIVNERSGFYNLLLLVTPAIERGKSATLLSELLAFKRAYDQGALLEEVLPALVAAHPDRYGGTTVAALCDQMHDLLRTSQADVLQRAVYNAGHEAEMVLPPLAAHTAMLRNQVDLVPLDQLGGRVAACLIVVPPPGIAVVVPGERFAPGSAALSYLRLCEESDNRFPGFENDLQGIFPRRDEAGRLCYHTYVLRKG